MNNMQQASDEELLNMWNPIDGQVTTTTMYSEEDYKNAQSFWTKKAQWEMTFAMKLVEKDKSEILNIPDKKLQNKIIKEIWWLDNLDELKLIHWDNFYKEHKSEDEELSDIERLNKELLLLKHNQAKTQLENEINDYVKTNPHLFKNEWNMDLLLEELRYISSDLSIKDRINRASKIAFWVNNVNNWYLSLHSQWAYVEWGSNEKDEGNSTKEEISNIFSRYFKK